MAMQWNPQEAVRAHAAAARRDRPERRSVALTGHALHEDGHGFHMQVLNLSYDGCAVTTDEPLAIGQAFKLSVLGRGGIDVEVVWAEGGKAGLRFAKPTESADGRTPRMAERLALPAEVSLRRPGRPNFTVRVCDVSTHGCRCEFVDRPSPGETLFVRFEGLEAIEAVARWVEPPLTGLNFIRPIHPAVFDLLVARHKPQ